MNLFPCTNWLYHYIHILLNKENLWIMGKNCCPNIFIIRRSNCTLVTIATFVAMHMPFYHLGAPERIMDHCSSYLSKEGQVHTFVCIFKNLFTYQECAVRSFTWQKCTNQTATHSSLLPHWLSVASIRSQNVISRCLRTYLNELSRGNKYIHGRKCA